MTSLSNACDHLCRGYNHPTTTCFSGSKTGCNDTGFKHRSCDEMYQPNEEIVILFTDNSHNIRCYVKGTYGNQNYSYHSNCHDMHSVFANVLCLGFGGSMAVTTATPRTAP